jgi:hypothetical protein
MHAKVHDVLSVLERQKVHDPLSVRR